MPFRIAIAGAGISGLATAVALSQDGHSVTVYEQRPSTVEESGNGVMIQASGLSQLKRWGLFDGFVAFSHQGDTMKNVRYEDGSVIVKREHPDALQYYWCLRTPLRKYLCESAIRAGATVHFNTRVRTINASQPSLTLVDGTTVHADIIIGSDGSNSSVRRSMFPHSDRLTTNDYVIQALVPASAMLAHPSLRALCADSTVRSWCGPGAWALSAYATKQSLYDLQIVLRDYSLTSRDPHPDILIEDLPDLTILGDRLDGWAPEFRSALGSATRLTKWRIVEAPRLLTALAPSGRAICIGDAFHAMHPSSGFGSSLAMENAAALAAALRGAITEADIPYRLAVYDRVQKERCEMIFAAGAANLHQFTLPDGAEQRKRDERLRAVDLRKVLTARPDRGARPGTPELMAWVMFYDPEEEVRKGLAAAAAGRVGGGHGTWTAQASKL